MCAVVCACAPVLSPEDDIGGSYLSPFTYSFEKDSLPESGACGLLGGRGAGQDSPASAASPPAN